VGVAVVAMGLLDARRTGSVSRAEWCDARRCGGPRTVGVQSGSWRLPSCSPSPGAARPPP